MTSDNPLEVTVFDSIRSPYSYLVVNRLAYLQSNYNRTVTMRVIFPGAIRMPDVAGGAVDDNGNQVMQNPAQETHYKQGGRWYKWADFGSIVSMPIRSQKRSASDRGGSLVHRKKPMKNFPQLETHASMRRMRKICVDTLLAIGATYVMCLPATAQVSDEVLDSHG